MELKTVLQVAGVVLGLLYLLLEYKGSIWLWPVGLLMPLVHSLLFFKAGLYADFGMEIYYVLAGLYGWVAWLWTARRGKATGQAAQPFRPQPTPKRLIPLLAAVYAVLHVAIYAFLRCCTDSTVPFWDALTTALSIVAMWMLSKKYTGQWLVWLAVDAVTVGLYFYKEIPLTAGLYLLYCAMAVAGYRKWRKQLD